MANKKAQQQEMVQVDRSERNTSPFWKSKAAAVQRNNKPYDTNTVVGASYSHADILKSMSHVLPRTPPRSGPPTSQERHSTTPPARTTTSPNQSYNNAYSQDTGSWTHDNDTLDEDDYDEIVYDDDEDEFGLPSIASMRKKGRSTRKSDSGNKKNNSTSGNNTLSLNYELASRQRANSSDIAEERGVSLYPSAKKSEGKILRPQYKEILKDPANSLNLINHSPPASDAPPNQWEEHSARISRINKFKRILQASTVSLSELRDLAWSGVPNEVRAMTWQLLLGYLPTNSERRVSTLERKRKEYLDGVRQAFERVTMTSGSGSSNTNSGRGRGLDEAVWHQISIDVPRTSPHLELYGYEATQRSLERILYVWAIRHPASGYVQGINDLVTPFWQVFLGAYITDFNVEEGMDPGQLPRSVLDAVEADSFWCLTKLLDGIQDNYIYAQPGIHRQVKALRDLVKRIDSGLANHLESEGVEFMQFSFRWMNCLLMREMSIRNTIRMWDTYMAEEQGFSRFHLYVCAAFLVKWTDRLLKMDFQEVMMFLQALPTKDWTEKEIELLLSEAFIWQSLFQDSSAHLRNADEITSGTDALR
ncbi:putative GTPase activating protein [Talaromyces proteolyticus]|uniref:GTPase activating protein n=1 Tax=Talaromyces proteolyticus TaxID=1131652 RepID=A0AAD4Q5U6_9EURO|nr:putative GTPase activating protein [Talaromyces proteolyticus]KAH8704727.1 putative GTPase activating protein [Talaromyces proteolyticus]